MTGGLFSKVTFVATLFLLVAEMSVGDEPGQRWAVLVGVNDYVELDDLLYCGKDAQGLAAQLVQAGFPEDNVFLVKDGATDSKNLPLKANIEARIRNVLAVAESNDLVLISFSGHGMHLDGKTYLCPSDARVDNPASTMIDLSTIYGNLERSRAARKLLWVDACRNDPRPSGSRSVSSHAKSVKGLVESLQTPPEGTLTLASCAADQISWEEDQFGHGVFMHFLMEGLAGKADQEERGNRDDKISLLELYNYANIKTKRFVLKSRDRVQTPELFGRITGDFDLAEIAGLTAEITNSIGMKLKLIPAGEFLMGSPEDEEGRGDNELQHRVRITRPFYLGTTEVTVGQFRKFVTATAYRTTAEKEGSARGFAADNWGIVDRLNWRDPGFEQSDKHPVICISWLDATAFCDWLSKKDAATYRLPTEAEWEYACRAETETVFYWGDHPNDGEGYLNGADLSGSLDGTSLSVSFSFHDGHVTTSPVGLFWANPWGLRDMHGNVYEWCQDWYGKDYNKTSLVDDPMGPDSGSYRVLRGGGWNSPPRICRSANREGATPVNRDIFLGFRVAQTPLE